jgi:hypothetical protein
VSFLDPLESTKDAKAAFLSRVRALLTVQGELPLLVASSTPQISDLLTWLRHTGLCVYGPLGLCLSYIRLAVKAHLANRNIASFFPINHKSSTVIIFCAYCRLLVLIADMAEQRLLVIGM